ncbi:Arginine N-succinyltransferase subunit beta [Leclercia adecarboxylata]|uniref:Arginine N-succinyltransferase subunit beta n=1 Tax=Leclercia adecarboxylata TaxID=83655 RepID=A0A4U9HRF1_9ENTR|nr:Arginine N-succinyltransferase subunit beta [Leclercia adecarboxylata]
MKKTLSARIERSLQTWQGTLPKGEQGYVFVLEEAATGTVAGICAIEVAVGLNDPWYNYRVGTLVHASKELNVYNALPTLFLSNDHTGSSELCSLFLDPDWRKEGNGYLLSKSRFLFMAAFRDRFNEKVVAEMRGVIDENRLLAVLAKPGRTLLLDGVQQSRLPVRHRTESLYCRADAETPYLYPFPQPRGAGRDRPGASANRPGARGAGERGLPLPQLCRHL